MILRDSVSLMFGFCLSLIVIPDHASAERWSRQVSNSEWIPLANPRSQLRQESQISQTSTLPELNLPPQLRQEYQSQLLQLQKTQESIQKLLLLQQQLRSQQQLLQNQAYLPNAVAPEEDKQAFHQSSISNSRNLPNLTPEILTPPLPPTETVPPVFSPQEFRQPSHSEKYSIDRPKVSAQQVSGPSNAGENSANEDEEIQVVYVPAETLAQRGHQHKEDRNRDNKQFTFPNNREQHQRYQILPNSDLSSPDDNSYTSDYVQFPKESTRTDSNDFLKAVRDRELERLNDQRREIQKQAKIQAAAQQREQERTRQREAEKKRKELLKIEEAARQRELDRIREARERQRLQELEREKERAAKARQAEIDRLASLERQKKLELEKLARKEEERAKQLAEKREKEASESVQQEYVGNNYHQQHLTESGKQKHNRNRAKPRLRAHHKNPQDHIERSHDTSTSAPTPNQPPLAVFMGSDDLIAQEVKIVDVLRVLREAKTIAVVDQVTSESPKVFVGPSNLDIPNTYSKFDLPYLSSLDTTRVERRVDKLPFFVAPLSFNPPPGYSKIPFPAPHIGSVIVNTIDGHLGTGPSGPSAILENKSHPSPHPLIEPNSFLSSEQRSTYQSTYQPAYESPTTPSYSTYGQDHVTQQYQPTVHFPPSGGNDRFRGRQNGQQEQQQYQSTVQHLDPTETPNASLSPYQEDLNASARPHRPDYPEEAISSSVTPGSQNAYRKPSVVSSYEYEQGTVSTTPVFENSYVHTRVQPNSNQELTSQLAQINQHDYSQHRHADDVFAHPVQQAGAEQHHGHHHAGENFESTISGSYEDGGRSTVNPSHYNLPAELPPIHPQLPGLVNSLIENKQDRTTTTTTETPTTTTEVHTSTYRTRTRHRGRVTRPLTTTTTSAPGTRESSRSSPERTRRPVSRSRSRYTTTTEDYKESYEPTRSKNPETTTKYSTSESYRRTTAPKSMKNKSRTSPRPYESAPLNQIQNTQPLETVSDESNPSLESGSSQGDSYSQYNIPISSESPESSYPPETDFSKTPNYPRPVPSHREQRPLADDTGIPQQHYQERYQSGLGYQASLIDQNDQYNYPINHEESHLGVSPAPNDYYYPDKSDSVEASGQQTNGPTENPIYTQILEYMPGSHPGGQQGVLSTEYNQSGQYSGEKNSGIIEDGHGYIHESSYEPVEETTEAIITTTTEAPVKVRQRTRGRLSSRTRQDSAIQTSPRGSQDDYVQFSAATRPPASRTSSSRQRDSSRRVKTRPQNQAQVQSEGEGFVRIQSSNRHNHPKTIVQTAKITTTTPTPLTTTEDSSINSEDIEYGFIRAPNFNQPQNQISSKFRAPDSQIQLQNVAPTDETAEDSSPSVTQIPKHRQKYQSPNRPRPDIKSTASSIITTTPSLEGYTNKPKVRAEEPKNRIRTRVRRPGNRRRPATTTTTTTTTEDVLDGNNNLPLDENYPRIPIRHVESSGERQLYDMSYETLPNAGEGAMSRVDYTGENYPQDFAVNFGGNFETEEPQDDLPLANPIKKHQSQSNRPGPSTGRLRAYSHHQTAAPERDIYGAESQWSTKLSKSSFQPSLNQLKQDDDKSINGGSEETREPGPEIITARPEEAFVTVLITSDDKLNDTKKEFVPQDISMESVAIGQNTSSEGTTMSSGISEENTQHPMRKTGNRRRRVRIRVRPASSTEDFVTSESQHINSAVNSLVQDHPKPESRSSTLSPPTTPEPTEVPTTIPPEMPSVNESIASTDETTIHYTKIPEDPGTSDSSDYRPMNNEDTVAVKTENDSTKPPTTPQTIPKDDATDEPTMIPDIATDSFLMTTMTVPRKSWDSANGYAEWFKSKQMNYFPRSQEQYDDSSESSGDNSHPKNHRSEWSKVRYPNDRGFFGYGRSGALTPTTQLPRIVTDSVGDSNVKILPDYVQEIFDTMKNADEERVIGHNGEDLWKDEQKLIPSTENLTHPNTGTGPEDMVTTMGIQRSEIKENQENNERQDFPYPNGKAEEGELRETMTNAPSDVQVSGKDEETNLLTSTSESPTTVLTSAGTDQPFNEISTEKNGKSASESILNAPTKLGTILRTSTTTKVSHMTEICYRGRCVMTKPRQDSRR
ncbi:mucin-2 [Diachasmimorpha longicaudata]|uniref:mucin-2 n=1 Tax=Diachasmimorpha longicaudata TaxID=58733 RepID=UPI0030B89DCA